MDNRDIVDELNVMLDMLVATTEHYKQMEEAPIKFLITANEFMLDKIRDKLNAFLSK